MVHYLKFLLVSIFFAQAALATTNVFNFGGPIDQSNPCVNVGLGTLSTTQTITISANTGSSTAGFYLAFTQWGSNSGQFQVPNGKTFKACSITVFCSTTSDHINFGFSTSSFVNDSTSVAPGGAKYFSSGASIPALILSTNTSHVYPFYAEFPQNTYPFAIGLQNSVVYSVQIVGVLQ